MSSRNDSAIAATRKTTRTRSSQSGLVQYLTRCALNDARKALTLAVLAASLTHNASYPEPPAIPKVSKQR